MRDKDKWDVRARYDAFNDGYDVVLRRDGAMVTQMTLTMISPHESIKAPTLEGDTGTSFLQAVLDCAWKLGMRPDGFADVKGELGATRKHLEDMRAIGFHKVGAVKP